MRVTAESLACVRGDRLIFRGLNFSLSSGGALVLTGPNGSGKTTLLRVIAGLLAATIGSVRFSNDDTSALTDDAHDQALHFVSSSDTVKPALSVREMLRFHADILGAERAQVDGAMKSWGLEHLGESPGALLSSGQRRRVALARLALQSRPLWLLDEPLVALDREARARLNDVCAAHRAKGGLIIAASHEPFLEGAPTLELGPRA